MVFDLRTGIKKIAILLVGGLFCCSKKEQLAIEPLFQYKDSLFTQIGFVNRVEDNIGQFSVVDYLYYYNGAGVACGDINNDGLTDVFFVANHGKNKLYLNRGNFHFQDISDTAGIAGFSDWKTGVTMADVNGDGYLDLYISAVGDYMGLEGSNELYINNTDNTFTERSAEFGLDFTGFSSQSAFLDYDKDGDLDMYLVTHAPFTSRSYNRVLSANLPPESGVDFFFRNDNGKFVDVSAAVGIRNAISAYGLGVVIADLNNDGWEDIYVTNDFYEGDYFWLNNKDGTFSERARDYFNHLSLFAKGCDAADLNNDGYQDLMTLDVRCSNSSEERNSFATEDWEQHLYKLSFGHQIQFAQNSLQINRQGVRFSEIANFSGIGATGHSWSPLIADFDNDGYKDIFITTGVERQLNDLDYLDYAAGDSMRYSPQLTGKQLREAFSKMPQHPSTNKVFKGGQGLIFRDQSEEWGMQTKAVSTGASYADLDNDGDLDIVTNVINQPAGVFENRSNKLARRNYLTVALQSEDKNTFGLGAKIYLKANGVQQMQQIQGTKGFLSSVEPIAHFGLDSISVVDSLIVIWNDSKNQILTNVPANGKFVFHHSQAQQSSVDQDQFQEKPKRFVDITSTTSIAYKHRENKYAEYYRERLIPYLLSMEGPKLAVGDVNGDSLEDIYASGAKYQPGALFMQDKSGSFSISSQLDFLKDSIYEDVDAAFIDVDNDHDVDLYVVSGGNEFYGKMDSQFDRLYINDGKGNFTRDRMALPEMFENKSCVRPYDFDNDGDVDLFVGGRVVGYHYGQSPRSYLLVNDGHGSFKDHTPELAPDLLHPGMVTDATWVDTDNDKDIDLVLCGDWMAVSVFENTKGKWKRLQQIVDENSAEKNINGFWQCLESGDFDGDGDIDLLAGNTGTNTPLSRNNDYELILYHGDFNSDTRNDQIMAYRDPHGKYVPLATRNEIERQFPALINAFQNNAQFSTITIQQLFEKLKIDPPVPLTVNQLASVYLENTTGNRFKIHLLPNEVQWSKLFTIHSGDFDADGNLDVLTGGNSLGSNVYEGYYDAIKGLLLRGDGKGSFKPVPENESGINVVGSIRDIKEIRTSKGRYFLIARNNDTVLVFKIDR